MSSSINFNELGSVTPTIFQFFQLASDRTLNDYEHAVAVLWLFMELVAVYESRGSVVI